MKATASHKSQSKQYRISGHESFSFRYAWLPKMVQLIDEGKSSIDDDELMVELGLGKNMVRSARFWTLATDVAQPDKTGGPRSLKLTPFGKTLFGKNGCDPYLEDIKTLWLLHWKLSTAVEKPLLAWDYLFSKWHEPEITRSIFAKKLGAEANRIESSISNTTVDQHTNVFFHTYVSTRGKKGKIQEDTLDCPLVELGFLKKIGEREEAEQKRREAVYAIDREIKDDISVNLFQYCIADFWQSRFFRENTLSLREIAHGANSPGRAFALQEEVVREHMKNVSNLGGFFSFSESSLISHLTKNADITDKELLTFIKAIYSAK